MAFIRINYRRGYNFTGKSPLLGYITQEVSRQRARGSLKMKDFETFKRASAGTVHNWTNGKTKRPQFDKAAGVLDLLGFEIVLRKKPGSNT